MKYPLHNWSTHHLIHNWSTHFTTMKYPLHTVLAALSMHTSCFSAQLDFKSIIWNGDFTVLAHWACMLPASVHNTDTLSVHNHEVCFSVRSNTIQSESIRFRCNHINVSEAMRLRVPPRSLRSTRSWPSLDWAQRTRHWTRTTPR